jgi:hypothetical protein
MALPTLPSLPSQSALLTATVSPQVTVTVPSTIDFLTTVNSNSGHYELLYRALGPGVLTGLVISAGTGLNVSITAGAAVFDGVFWLAATTTYSVPASQAAVYLWISSAGAISHTLTTTAPTGRYVYLGQVVTSGSAVTSVDRNGVLTVTPMGIERTLAATPSDTLPTGYRVYTWVSTALYLWNGTAHRQLLT